MTFSLSSAAPSNLIFLSGVTSGELFSSAGNAKGSDLPDNDDFYDEVSWLDGSNRVVSFHKQSQGNHHVANMIIYTYYNLS